MALLYNIEQSPGKGRGAFAVKKILPGTTVMTDPVAMKINKPQKFGLINESDVARAFEKMSKADQAHFMALHEGHRPYQSRLFRTYKANAFGDVGEGRIHLEVSLINHSCVPNAEAIITEKNMEIVAVKPISKGGEIFINYSTLYNMMTRKQRQALTRVYYGFECSCQACSLEPKEQALSDSRREILRVLLSALAGHRPYDFRFLELVGTITPAEAESPAILRGMPMEDLQKPLSLQQDTTYSVLAAHLLQAEGLFGEAVGNSFIRAAHGLTLQVDRICSEYGGLVIVSMAKLAKEWTEDGLSILREVRGQSSSTVRSAEQNWEKTQMQSLVGGALQMLSKHPDSFAFQIRSTPEPGTFLHPFKRLTKGECKKILGRKL